MATDGVRCALVKIHGIGKQAENWSADFDGALEQRLVGLTTVQQRGLVQESVWWADLSQLASLESLGPVSPLETSAQYTLAYQQYAAYLVASEAVSTGSAESLEGPIGDFAHRVIARLKDTAVTAADQCNDVANYISNNGVRLAVQRRLSDRLLRVRADHPHATIVLGSHSQGTIISYDVLRLLGPWLGKVIWVTMGCPLGWYLNFGRWGAEELGIQGDMTWLNLFDRNDIVGKSLGSLVPWDAPRPNDVDVDNVGHGLDAHDHWHNEVVVDRYFDLITQLV